MSNFLIHDQKSRVLRAQKLLALLLNVAEEDIWDTSLMNFVKDGKEFC